MHIKAIAWVLVISLNVHPYFFLGQWPVSLFRSAQPFFVKENGTKARQLTASKSSTEGIQVNVLTQHNNTSRTGANLDEVFLNTANVNARQFGKLFSRALDGYVYAQPLYVLQLSFPDQSLHNVVYVATEHDSVYAFDADDASATEPLWQAKLGEPIPSGDISPDYRDLVPEIGITGTPVIDPDSQTLYVVAKSKDIGNGAYHQKLHALNLTTGQDKPGSPVEITASVQGKGKGSIDGKISFDPLLQVNRPALLLLNGVVYIAFGSHGDIGNYHGWVLGYDAATLAQTTVFNTTPDGGEAAVWQSGQGLVADSTGNIYLVTGNGTFTAQDGGRDYGCSAIKLSTKNGLSVVDWFSPHNQDVLTQIDADLGAGGPLLLPGNRLLLVGKDTVLRMLDANDLGRIQPQIDRIVQQFQASTRPMLNAPVYWESDKYGPAIYYWAATDPLKVFKLRNGQLDPSFAAQSSVLSGPSYTSAPPMSLSAYGSQAGTGILWATSRTDSTASGDQSGVLHAMDASDVTKELWNSLQNKDRDDLGNFAKFCPPTVANGKVYVATFSGQLQVYGHLPGVCNFNFSQANQFVYASEGSGSVSLAVEDGCNWLANTNQDWINISSGGEGTGTGSILYTVSPNPSGLSRTGSIFAGGLEYKITQAGTATATSAASFDTSALASESIATALGVSLAATTEAASTATLPTSLGGTAVSVTDGKGVQRPAPLFFVSSGQVNYQIPPDTMPGLAIVTITSASGNIATAETQIERVAPGIFSANATGQGVAAAVALRVKADGRQFFESVSQFDEMAKQFVPRPIDLGPDLGNASDRVFLLLFGTGWRFRSNLNNVQVMVGGVNVATVYAGAQGGFVGLDQMNIELPRTLIGQEDVDVVVIVDGKTANTVKINLK